MKTKDKKELRTKSFEEVKKLLKEEQDVLMTLQLDKEQNKLKDTSSLSRKRKDIAVLQTILKEKEEK